MESPSTSSSSRVKVEYTDPSGIFPLISKDINSRLPLHNLHWNSASRPLRSIDSLYVELIPDEKNRSISQSRSVSSAGISGSHDSISSPGFPVDARRESEPVLRRERRHQIPGLRQTPYLKVYFLRCDDAETYKASSRKLLREWIKAHTPPSQSSTPHSSQESHDAFDWMILHVVLPDVQISSVWPSRNSSSVLEKIRADFNSSSKSSVDRVAQVPATRSLQVQGVTVNPIPTGPAKEEFLREAEKAWEDLLGKIKSSILTSFDLRVHQYEEDIKEKSSQRNLPGWNFCTFFVLKEGLARGFESVGLVVDALMGYDELAVELDVAIKDQKQKSLAGLEAGLFREHTQELLIQAEIAMAAIRGVDVKKSDVKRSSISILDADRKSYRELILANNISVFDFQSYVFARQVALLSRIAGLRMLNEESQPASSEKVSSGRDTNDLTVVAEICRRAIQFITSTCSIIREDLKASFKIDRSTDEQSLALRYCIIENIIASWTFSSCNQILHRTEEEPLARQIQVLTKKVASPISSPRARSPLRNEPGTQRLSVTGLSGFPNRMSSLIGGKSLALAAPSQPAFPDELAFSKDPPSRAEALTGLDYLAAQRAELYLITRRALSGIGFREGWKTGWSAVSSGEQIEDDHLDEISLEEASHEAPSDKEHTSPPSQLSIMAGLQNEGLHTALSSRSSFFALYEDLTIAATQLYQVSGDQKSANTMVADLAIVRYSLEDFAAAAGYFHHLAPFYAQDDWSELEMSILDMYAQCLQKLGRKSDYVRIALKIVAKDVQKHRRISGFKTTKHLKSISGSLDRQMVDTRAYLRSLLVISKDLKEMVTTPLKRYFALVHINPHLRHFDDKDGFELAVDLRYVMPLPLKAQKFEVRLVSATEGQSRDIWLSSKDAVTMIPGQNQILVASNVLVYDWYIVDKIRIQADNVVFLHDLSAIEGTKFFTDARDQAPVEASVVRDSRILVWPSQKAFELQVSLCPDIHLEKPKSVIFELSSGHNHISGGRLLVRAGSAGLRLHTGDAETYRESVGTIRTTETGVVHFDAIQPSSTMKIQIPYKLENDMKEIIIRAEVTYSTIDGEFVYAFSQVLPILLPLGVNVQDVFKHDVLFSKFAMSSSTSIPLRLLSCLLQGTDDFEATSPKMEDAGLFVSTKQPVSMVYRIVPRKRNQAHKLQTKLSLHIDYVCLDEEIVAVVKECFSTCLKHSEFVLFSRLLLPVLGEIVQASLSPQALELYGLLREFELGKFEKYRWEPVLVAIPEEDRQSLTKWLMDWHEKHKTVRLPNENNDTEVRTITIPVDVPQMHVIHTARIYIGDPSMKAQRAMPLIAVGDAIPAELTLRSSYIWDSRGSARSHGSEEFNFYYEFEANPDTWLIGGQRKAYFSTNKDVIQTFPLLLIPQRAGHLLYPSLEIRHVDEALGHEASTTASPLSTQQSPITSDVDYQNQGESIQVVPNLRSTTVSLESEGSMGGPWLVESQPRQRIPSS